MSEHQNKEKRGTCEQRKSNMSAPVMSQVKGTTADFIQGRWAFI